VEPEYAEITERWNAILSLPNESAKRRVIEALKKGQRLQCCPTCGRHADLIDSLPPLARELFCQFDAITTHGGEGAIGPAYFHDEHRKRHGCLIVGGGEDEGCLAIRPPNEAIFVLDLGYSRFDLFLRSVKHRLFHRTPWHPAEEPFAPTVYHAVLLLDDQYNGEW
jgi:hypothetical protein